MHSLITSKSEVYFKVSQLEWIQLYTVNEHHIGQFSENKDSSNINIYLIKDC